jgi:hypothetical protein
MNGNIARNIEQSRNNVIINCPTQLHLVGYFYKICATMYGSMNVKHHIHVFVCNSSACYTQDMFV